MKTSLFSSILLSTLFYTSLLSTMFVMPLVVAARYDDAGTAAVDRTTVDRDAGAWDRVPEAPAKLEPNRDVRRPHGDASVAEPAAKQAPIDKSDPDAGMIKPGKVRAKAIRV